MKRLVVLLAVLVTGFGAGSRCFGLNAGRMVRVAVSASGDRQEKPSGAGAPDKQSKGKPKSGAKAEDPNEPAENKVSANKPAEGKDGSEADAKKGDEAKEAEEIGDPNDPLVAINLNNLEVKNLLPKLADWTGKVIIPSEEAMKKKIFIFSPKKVPQSVALTLIYDSLRDKGIIAEISEHKIFLKPISQAKTGYVPVLKPDEPLARIEDKSMIVEKYFKLENASPSKIVNIITPLTASYGHVTASESAGTVSVIDTVENLLRIQQTIQQFDVPESDQVHEEIFEIKNGDPAEIVQILELILEGRSSSRRRSNRPSSRRPPSRSPSRGSSSPSQPATSVVLSSGDVPIILLPIPKQNWIIARASAEDIELIRKWVKKLDIKESVPLGRTIIPIAHLEPYDVVRLVEDTIQEMPGSELETSVAIEAVRNTQQVVVFGSEENRKIVEALIAEIDVPLEDTFKTRVFKLEHTDPDEIKENIDGLYEQEAGSFSSYSYRGGRSSSRYRRVDPKEVVKVISFPTMNQVTVIASKENLRKIEEQIAEWDVPLDLKEDQYRLVTLENSDPKLMVELLNDLFSEESENDSFSFFRRYLGNDDSDSKKKIVGSLYGLFTFKAVPGAKKVLVISKVPEAYDVVEKLILDLDSQEKGESPKVLVLKYADPEELCDQLNAILNEPGTTATIRRRKQGLTLQGYAESEKDKNSQNNQNNQNQQDNSIKPWWNQARGNDDEMPTSNLIGKVRFVPVYRSKAILVLAPPEYYPDIEKMVEALDQPEMQVMIEAVIVEVDHSSMTSLGVKLSSDPGAFSGVSENALKALNKLMRVEDFTSGVQLTSNLDINVLVDLLAKTIDAKVLNQPNLWTKDNEEALFFKGREISLVTSDTSYTTGQSNKTQYDRIPVGVTLKVRPNITPEKDVDINVELEISSLAAEEVNTQPVLSTINTITNLIIGDGETLMLGGILFQNERQINTKVPLLGDIPIAGALFNHDDTVQRNNELLIFLTPHVVTDGGSPEAERYVKPKSESEQQDTESPLEKMRKIRESLNSSIEEGLLKEK